MKKNDTKSTISIVAGLIAIIFGIAMLYTSKCFIGNLGEIISIAAVGHMISCIILFILNLLTMLLAWGTGLCTLVIGYYILKGDI